MPALLISGTNMRAGRGDSREDCSALFSVFTAEQEMRATCSMPCKQLLPGECTSSAANRQVNASAVNVALPSMEHELHTSLSTVSWTISAYALMIGVFPMGMGRLADLWGQRKMYLAGLVIFTLASLACGFAFDILSLIAFRAIQGIGAAIMTPGTLAIVVRAFPQRQRGLAIGIHGGVSGLGLIAGPALGGLLVQSAGWRWVFFINVPLGLIALAMTMLFVPDSRDAQASPQVDWVVLGLLCIGLLCVIFACTRASTEGWTSATVEGSGVIGIMCLAIFVAVERRVHAP